MNNLPSKDEAWRRLGRLTEAQARKQLLDLLELNVSRKVHPATELQHAIGTIHSAELREGAYLYLVRCGLKPTDLVGDVAGFYTEPEGEESVGDELDARELRKHPIRPIPQWVIDMTKD